MSREENTSENCKQACSFIMFLLYKTYEITNRAGLEKIFGFIIEQAKIFASRVTKNRKIVPEHALLLGTRE